jgi:hypothetical protein
LILPGFSYTSQRARDRSKGGLVKAIDSNLEEGGREDLMETAE